MDPWSDFEDGYVSTSLGEIFYRRRPSDSKEILFLHGMGASTKAWSKLFPLIPKEIGIFAIDFLGHGKSDAPKMDYDIMVQVRMLEELLKKMPIDPLFIFGHSYGAWAAAHYATRNKVSALILEDPAGLPESAYKDPAQREGFFQTVSRGEVNKDAVRSMVDNSTIALLNGDVLSKISCKTLIIWGSNDPLVDPKLAPGVQSAIKGSSLLMVEGADHNPHYSKADTVAKAITDFLS